MSAKSCNPQFVMGTIVPGILINNACCKNKKKKHRKKIEKWIHREIEFKEKISDEEKAKIINETEKRIVESLYDHEFSGLIIKSIRFFVKSGTQANCMSIGTRVIFMFYKEGTDTGKKDPKHPV